MGDMNAPWRKGGAVERLALGLGLSAHRPNDGEPTYPLGPKGRRLDWILVSPDLEFLRYAVLPDRVSDHLAVAAELRLR